TFQVLLSQLPFVHITPASPEVFGAPLSLEILETIILNIRLPRIFLAGLVGAALAVAGATYQGLFRNPLADPYLLGVASITSYLMTISGEELHGIVFWLLGGLYLTKWSEVWTVLPCV
ncbi:unnamed protein product, partial [marine sediment metagenome]